MGVTPSRSISPVTRDFVLPARPRLFRIHAFLGVLIGGHLLAVLLQRELWPFSNYPMYAESRREWSFEAYQLGGERADRSDDEFPLDRPQYIEPFSAYGLNRAFETLAQRPDREALLSAALKDRLASYERRRLDGDISGPRLIGLRLYRVRYGLNCALNPKRRDRSPIESRRLVATYVAAPGVL
jgi:hypothetical protein